MKMEKADRIVTPVSTGRMVFHEGGVEKFWGPMECSKTRAMIALTMFLVDHHYYDGSRVFSNTWIDIPGAHWLSNREFRKILRRAFNTEIGRGRWNKCIFAIMEADGLYSHITQSDQECFNDIKYASQALKRNQHLMYEIHEGRAVPKYLRDKTEISIRPFFDASADRVDLFVIDGQHGPPPYIIPVNHISRVNNRYRRFDPIL